MALENGIEQRFRALERDVRALEEDGTYARDQRSRLWNHVTDLEKDIVGLQRDVTEVKRLAAQAAENSVTVRAWVEERDREASEKKRLSRGQFWTIVGIVVALVGVLFSAVIGVIQLSQGLIVL